MYSIWNIPLCIILYNTQDAGVGNADVWLVPNLGACLCVGCVIITDATVYSLYKPQG